MREWINDGHWVASERLPAELDLVQRLGVSRGTVRSALQQLEAEGILQELPGRGRKTRGRIVAPAAHGHSAGLLARTVAVVTQECEQLLDNPDLYGGGRAERAVDSAIIQGVHALKRHSLCITAAAMDEREVSRLIAARPSGVIAARQSCWSPLRPLLERLAAGGVRVAVTSHGIEPVPFDSVVSDHEAGAYELTRWLLARGRRRILEMGTVPSDLSWVVARSHGYARAMAEAGLESIGRVYASNVRAAQTVVRTSHPDAGGWVQASESTRETLERAREVFELRIRQIAGFVAAHALRADRVDAIMASNDWDASIILGACRLLGLEPNKQVAVVGYDDWWDTAERAWEPAAPLATMNKRNADVGREAVRMLIDRIEGKLPAEPQVRRVEPVLREVAQAPENAGIDRADST